MSDEADRHAHEAIAAEEKRTAKAAARASEKAAKKEASKTTVKAAASSPAEANVSQETGPYSPALHPDLSASASVPASSDAAAAPPTASSQQQLPPRLRKSCWSCSAKGVPLKKCSACAVAAYCSAGCQNADWKAHKEQCAYLKTGTASVLAGVTGS